jgi:hypothetical protein
MIIKSTRIKARGQGLKRALRHIMDGEDNDSVELLCGNVADLNDARNDALRFGREYAIRSWVLSPGEPISKEQLSELVDRLAVEFGFDPQRAAIWKHTKDRASEDGCKEHYHLCAPEIDPLTGGVMSSSHDWRRHEKLARTVEVLWGHATINGPHMQSVVAALQREGNVETAATLRGSTFLDHPQSFDQKAQQRLKRSGYDLPRLRVIITEALAGSKSHAEFESKLTECGLRIRTADRIDTPIIESADGSVMIGSLARLTRLRKNALLERLKFNAEARSKGHTHHSSSDLSAGAAVGDADRANLEARRQQQQQQSRPTGYSGYDGESVGEDGGWHRSGSRSLGKHRSASRRSASGQSDKGGDARLKVTLGCLRHEDRLLDLLGVARRSALPPLDRVASDLDNLIECETRAQQVTALPEPDSLHAARQNVEATSARLETLESRARGIEQKLVSRQRGPIWRRLWRSASASNQSALETQLDRVQRKIQVACGNHTSAMQMLKTEETKFRLARAQHDSAQSARRTQAPGNIALAQAARKFLESAPYAARWGAPHLLRIAADIRKARAEWKTAPDSDLQDDWSLIPIVDLWNKPYLPPR